MATEKRKTRSPSKSMKNDKSIAEGSVYQCVCCGARHEDPVGKFYKTKSKMFTANNFYIPICSKCINDKFDELRAYYDDKTATMMMCHYADVPFVYAAFDGLRQKDDKFGFGVYLRQMNAKQYVNKTFVDTLLDKKELGIDAAGFEEIKERTRWNIGEHRNKNNAIDIIGFDPFEGYTEQQRKFLFNNIIGYLEEDGIEDDNYKLSQIIQLVINNWQINQIDIAMAKINMATHMDDLKTLQSAKKSLVDSNDKIAKENGISAKNRLNKQAGQGTLTALQKYLRTLDIPAAEANYYDQLRGDGTQWAANMSFKAIKENTFFDENDEKDVAEMQYKLIQDLQAKLDDAEEENRLLLIENDELKEGQQKKKGGK